MRRNLGLRIGSSWPSCSLSRCWYLLPAQADAINLGLDLQGGIHLVLGRGRRQGTRGAGRAGGRGPQARTREARAWASSAWPATGSRRARGRARHPAELERRPDRGGRVRQLRRARSRDQAAGRVRPRHARPARWRQLRELTRSARALETIRNRVDQFGVAEPIDPAAGRRIASSSSCRACRIPSAPRRSSARPRCSSSSSLDEQSSTRAGAGRPAARRVDEILYQRRIDKETKRSARSRTSSRRRRC